MLAVAHGVLQLLQKESGERPKILFWVPNNRTAFTRKKFGAANSDLTLPKAKKNANDNFRKAE